MGQQVIVETMPHVRALTKGHSIGRWPVVESSPGQAPMAIEFPDHFTQQDIEAALQEMRDAHLIKPLPGDKDDRLARPVQGGYHTLGELHPLQEPLFAPGDTFPIVGVTSETQRRGQWGASTLVGICDTGVDGGHPWFDGKDLRGDLSDTAGHGTFCSGIMVGAQGIASDASLLMRTVLPGGNGTEVGVAGGIRECAEAGCKVINLSLGGGESSLIDAACNYARQLGAIVVAAAGNTAGATIGSPARAADVIVLATNRDGQYTSFTSGRNWTNQNRSAAPGENDVSAAVGGGVTSGSGTSFSAPHVTAMLALLMASGLNRTDALTYLFAHRTGAPDRLTPVLTEDFGSDAETPGGDTIRELADIGTGLVQKAQADRCDWDADYDAYRESMVQIMDHDIGPLYDVFQMIRDALPKVVEPPPPPPPPPPPVTFALPLPDGAVYGKKKWLPDSKGCDLFVKRNTPVYSPDDCVVRLVRGGTGLEGGAEVILAKPDNSWAWRYRHVRATVRVGDHVARGSQVAFVFDSSMDLLGHVPTGFPAPDNYQHLDLSVNQGTDQFSPQGGGGGNQDSYLWLTHEGYKGVVVERTPGPNDARPFDKGGDKNADSPSRAPESTEKGKEEEPRTEKPKNKGGRPKGSGKKKK